MSEHNLPINDKSSSELISPNYHPIAPLEEQTILSSYINEQDSEKTTNEIIHSPYHTQTTIEYKKELPSDILDKYAGIGNKKQQQQQQQSIHGKKNKKNKKVILFTFYIHIDLFSFMIRILV
jgi:hypothetical protein